jgi:rubrerythrin
MKTLAKLVTFAFAVAIIFGCTSKPVKTIENLKAAYNGESTASTKYASFAAKAKAEGYDTIAVMFEATSKSESIHAANHLKVLEKLGVKIDAPHIGQFEVKSTAENLEDAIKGEGYEIDTMYPGFIDEAKAENSNDAVKSFTWAINTEKKHKAFYQNALDAINAGGEIGLPVSWEVCPVCGNTYDAAAVPEACDFCMTPREKFLSF